jgi:hypothetical protein
VEGGAWARASGVARVLFIGFFFSHAELQDPQIEKQAAFPQKTGLRQKTRFENENRGAGRRFRVPWPGAVGTIRLMPFLTDDAPSPSQAN